MMRTNRSQMSLTIALATYLLLSANNLMAQEVQSVSVSSKPTALSLSDAMNIAESNSHLVRAAKAGLDSATARVSQTKGGIGPKIGLEVNEVWYDHGVNDLVGHSLPNGTPVPDRVNTAAIALTQPITSIFTLNVKEKGDKLLANAATADVQTAARDARARVAAAFIRVLKANKFLEITQESQRVIEKQLSDAGKLKSQGKLAQLDFSRLEFAKSEAVTLSTDAKANLTTASAALRELLNLGQKQDILEIRDTTLISPEAKPEGKERPEVIAARSRVDATKAYTDASHISYWPTINSFARYGRDFTSKDIKSPAVSYDKEDIQDNFSYGFQFNWTLWDWNVRRGQVRELGAEMSRSEAMRDELQSNIRVEQIQAQAEVTRAVQNESNAKTSSDLSEKIFKATEAKFRNGLATTTDLLMAERDLTRARANVANATYDLTWAHIQLKKAMGGDLK